MNQSWPAGFVVNPRQSDLDKDILERYKTVPVTQASDCRGRITGAMGLKPYHNDPKLGICGMAITVRVRPGDNLMLHKAMLMAKEGDVIVVDGGGDLTQAIIGGLMRTTALTRKLGGFVINGAIRDLDEWAEGKIAIYAKGNTYRGPSKVGPGEVNVPVSCAGMVVNPGDLILADADGVIAIARSELETLLPKVEKHNQREAEIRAKNEQSGGDEERFDTLLRQLGCPV